MVVCGRVACVCVFTSLACEADAGADSDCSLLGAAGSSDALSLAPRVRRSGYSVMGVCALGVAGAILSLTTWKYVWKYFVLQYRLTVCSKIPWKEISC